MSDQHHRTPSTNLHCTARGRPTSSAAVVLLRGRPTAGCCFFKACAGRIVRRLCSPAAAWFCGLCVPARLCHAMPTALLNVLAPVLFVLLCPLFIPCAPGSPQASVCKLQDCPVGSCNTGLQWQPVCRLIFDFLLLFSCRVHDPGPWVSVNL